MKKTYKYVVFPNKIRNFKIKLSIVVLSSIVLLVSGLILYIDKQKLGVYLISSSYLFVVLTVYLLYWQFYYCNRSITVLYTSQYKSGDFYIKTPFREIKYQITDITWGVKKFGFRSPAYRLYLVCNGKQIFNFLMDYWNNVEVILQLSHEKLDVNVIKDLRNKYGYFYWLKWCKRFV